MPDQADLQLISGRLERGEIDKAQFLEQLLRHVAGRIGCSRAGLRLFIETPEARVMRQLALFDREAGRMVSAPDILVPEPSPYLERLRRDGSVAISHVARDPLTIGALREHLRALDVVSTLDMGCSVNGVLFGSFHCEQIGLAVDWPQRKVQALRKIASRASLTLMHLVNSSVDTGPGALWEPSTPNRLATMPAPFDPASRKR